MEYPPTDRGRADGPPFATLDADVQDSFGPETVTIYQLVDGTYRFFVKKFDPNAVGALAQSLAVVKIYTGAGLSGTGLYGTREVPTVGNGNVWHVCDVDGATRSVTWMDQILGQDPLAVGPQAARPPRPRPKLAGRDFGAARFVWDLGDGTISTEVEPQHAYLRPGAYTVQLAVFAGESTNTPAAMTNKVGFIVVTNTPPRATLLSPAANEVFRAGTDIKLLADALDEDGEVRLVEFFAVRDGVAAKIGQAAVPPYSMSLTNVAEGRLAFFARAIDDFDGVGQCPPVPVLVLDLTGDVLIIRNFEHPEIDALKAYLAELPVPNEDGNGTHPAVVRVIDQEGLKFDLVNTFLLIIWDDLGDFAQGLTDNDVQVLHQGWTFGIPLYLIGERLASALVNLSEPYRSQWRSLTHLGDVTGFIEQPIIAIKEPRCRERELFCSLFGGVEDFPDFPYQSSVEETTLADNLGEVRASANESPVLVRYPRFGEIEGGEARTLTQNFLVTKGPPDDASLEERRKAFLNASLWLLGFNCDYFEASIICSGQTLEAQVGQPVELTLRLSSSGRCPASGVVVTNELPEGLEFVGGSLTSEPEGVNAAKFVVDDGRVLARLGEMAQGSAATLTMTLVPKLSGDLVVRHVLRANYRPPETCLARIHVVEGVKVVLRIEMNVYNWVRVFWKGTGVCQATLQKSSDLIRWSDVTTDDVDVVETPVLEKSPDSTPVFYRAVVLP